MRARQVVLVGVLAVAALLAGCAAGPPAAPGATPRPAATPVTAMGCAETEVGPSAGAVPAGFAAVAVYLCDPHATETDAEGTWLGSRLTRYEGDLAALLAALAAPDAPPTDGACPAIAFVGPWLWLEGDAGTYVRAAYPSNACGMPRTDAVFAALDKLTVADEHFEPGRLVDTATPGTATPGTATPGTAVPGTATPGTAAPTAAPSIAARGSEVTVELDGCRRLIDRAHRAFAAPDALLALLGAA
ncbi:hypothetical protein [Microbacterium sp.]|uniref:hypothetical protein n=1 Tax=Microbacterium sp. TaxID=51671 RepID=UPI003A931D8C